jgi:hypothetical protein
LHPNRAYRKKGSGSVEIERGTESYDAEVVQAAVDDRAAGRVYNVGETDTLTEAE